MADNQQEITSNSTTASGNFRDAEMPGNGVAAAAAAGSGGCATPDVHGAGAKIERAKSAYEAYAGSEERPGKLEVFGWCFYGLCSYFIHTVLIPIVFPLIISQISMPWPDDVSYDSQPATEFIVRKGRSLVCRHKEVLLYGRLTNDTITVSNSKYTPLEWTSISWAIGLALAAPALGFLSGPLDHGSHQSLIAFATAVIGAAFCLPTGFFRTVWIFPPYIAAIVATSTIAAAHHTRHLGLLVCSFVGTNLRRPQFPLRRAASGWLSLASTTTGFLGAAVISAFAYHMLREKEELMSLWIVSIFSGLKWLIGSIHFLITSNNNVPPINPPKISSTTCHPCSILRFPHALASLLSIFLASLSTMSVFIGAVLYLVGDLCLNPKSLLHLWLTYFLFPLVSLPMLHPIQHIIRSSAVKMLLLGFFLTAAVSGLGFAVRHRSWGTKLVLAFAAVQGTAAGVLHAFGRVLLLDCTPRGKEGAFSGWFVWARAAGSCIGFAIASANPGRVEVSFGLGFCTAVSAAAILIFGNVSDLGGAIVAGHVRDYEDAPKKDEKRGSPVNGVDDNSASIQETP